MNIISKMFKNKNVRLFLIVAISVFIGMLLGRKTSMGYALRPIGVTVDAAPGSEGSLFDRPNKIECVPGPQADAAYYSKDLTPGGICGDQAYVSANADYKITGGIGGSLLDDVGRPSSPDIDDKHAEF